MMNKIYSKVLFKVIIAIPLIWLMIFWPAGFNYNYWQGWLFFGFLCAFMAAAFFFFRKNLNLAKERMSMGKGKDVPLWDKIIFGVFVIFSALVPVIAAQDAGQYLWTQPFQWYIYVLAYAAFLIGVWINFSATNENKFFSSVVRIQKDRGHKVITTGLYSVIRHPGYAGGILFLPALSLMLGSLYGLIPSAVVVIALIWRTSLEDKFLYKNLPGYKEYTKKVKYRLIPGIW